MYSVYRKAVFPKEKGNVYARTIRNLFKALKNNDSESVWKNVADLIEDVISGRILDNERVYQAFLIGMMMGFNGNYRIYGDTLETGNGFANILFERRTVTGSHMIIKLKKSKNEKDLQKDTETALKQIHEKGYMRGLDGRSLLYGISFFKKTPYILSKEHNL